MEGDAWVEVPKAVLFSGGVNRLAIEDTIQRFERREGARVTRVYNGCGILVSQMKAGQHPDAYFACDVSFLPPVKDLFLEPLNVSETDIVLLVAKGNPLHCGADPASGSESRPTVCHRQELEPPAPDGTFVDGHPFRRITPSL